jgi:hypothetical protein
LDVLDGCLDGVLGEHAAVQLDGGQAQVLGDLTVLDAQGIVQALAPDPFRGNAAAGDCRPTSEGLELGVHNVAIVIHLQGKAPVRQK